MEPLSLQEKEALAARCWRSHSEFCRIFLADWFPTKMPWVHRGIAALILGQADFLLDFGPESWKDDPDAEWTPKDLEKILTNFLDEATGQPLFKLSESPEGKLQITIEAKDDIVVIMPRGFSKTTLFNSINLKLLLYKAKDFFLYVSESGAHAERQLGTIKNELEDNDGLPNNEAVIEVFGLHKPGRQSPLKWTENFIETLGGVMVGAVGRGGQIRGFGKKAKRPKIITFDDLEDEESVASETQVAKTAKWFWSAAMPAIHRGGRRFIMGTLLGTECLLASCMDSGQFTSVRFGAIDRQGDALWSYMMSLEQIEAKKQAMAKVGQLASFYFEYMSEARDDEARIFPESKLIYISKPVTNFVGMALVQDPAISDRPSADFCSYAVAGIEAGGHKHILDYYGEKGMDPAAQVDKFFELYFRWLTKVPPEFRKAGIEAIAYQRSLIHLVKSEQFQRSKTHGLDAYFEIIPILHGKKGKMARVQGILKPLIASGYLSFQQMWPDLHLQFVEWPNSKLDGPDACAMSISLLDPFAALNLGEDGVQDLEKDSDLSIEQVIGGRFGGAP